MSILKYTRSNKEKFILNEFRDKLESTYGNIKRLVKDEITTDFEHNKEPVSQRVIDDICEPRIEEFRRHISAEASMILDSEYFGKGQEFYHLMSAINRREDVDTFGVDADSCFAFGPDPAAIVTFAVNILLPKQGYEFGAAPANDFQRMVAQMSDEMCAHEMAEFADMFVSLKNEGILPDLPTYLKMNI